MSDFDAEGYLHDSPIRPEMALVLWFAAGALVERAERDVHSVAGNLPPIAKPWADISAWADQLAGCYRMVRDRLAVAAFPLARCTGEEFALHMTIAAGAALAAQGLGPDPADHGMQLMPLPEDEDFAAAHDDLFGDQDLALLLLWQANGVEDPVVRMDASLGIGPYLHPSRWFQAFPGYRGPDLERLNLEVEADDDVIAAAAELALSAGARGTVQIFQDGDRWLARARYPRRELVGEGPDPHAASTALVRLILEGSRCPSCGSVVTIDPGNPTPARCHWERLGRTWQPGCSS